MMNNLRNGEDDVTVCDGLWEYIETEEGSVHTADSWEGKGVHFPNTLSLFPTYQVPTKITKKKKSKKDSVDKGF